MTRALIRLVTRLTLVLLAVALLAGVLYALLFTAVAAQFKGVLTLLAVQVLNLPPGVADVAAWTMAVAAAGPAVWFAGRFLLGRVAPWEVGLVLVCVCVAAGAVRVAIADWLFYEGRPIVFICPPSVPGELPRARYSSFDPLLGTPCPPATRETAATLLSIRRGVVPKPLEINSLAEFDALQLFDSRSGLPLVFLGASHPGQAPRLYEGAGHDPIAGDNLLAPMTRERIGRVRAYFADRDQKREEKKRLAQETAELKVKAEAEALAAAERARQQREAQDIAARRALAIEQERARQEEARARACAEERRRREAELRLEELRAQNLRDAAKARQAAEESKRQSSAVRPVGPLVVYERFVPATQCVTDVIHCTMNSGTPVPVGSRCSCWAPILGHYAGVAR